MLKVRNPQLFQQVEGLVKNNGNPMELFKQITGNYSPEQMEQLYSQAKQFGISDDVINQVQNGINANSVDIK